MKNRLFALTTLTVIALAVGAVVAASPSKQAPVNAEQASYTAPAVSAPADCNN